MSNVISPLRPEDHVITTLSSDTLPSTESVLDKLARSLQDGDVALILTRAKLNRLIEVLDSHWTQTEDFEILTDLKKLKEARR